ncbi:hypothetical protein C6T65_33050 [Burkholderia vietnamiensis]|uniref:Uncharacterized protein n=1 Tax=Burkholderia vietnamiensis TaxID=60552 RepID=A0AA45B9M7_BURVI|nr:hypothetical protein C6T65_33050 [Burkholderia vietnamiensis]
MKKDARASPATGHGGSIDDSVFRARAQEARAAGRRDAGPVGRPGQPAAHRERARRQPRRGRYRRFSRPYCGACGCARFSNRRPN